VVTTASPSEHTLSLSNVSEYVSYFRTTSSSKIVGINQINNLNWPWGSCSSPTALGVIGGKLSGLGDLSDLGDDWGSHFLGDELSGLGDDQMSSCIQS
jgi:hypothetical protein